MTGMSYREDDEIMDTFVQEMLSRLEEMESGLEGLAPGLAPDRETVDDVFRAAHSLKASANLLQFRNIEAVTHGLETVLDDMRWGRLVPREQTMAALTRCLDTLHFLFEDLEAGDEADISETLADIGKAAA